MNTTVVETNKYKFFAVGAIGTFMSTLDGSILNVALPSIADDLNCKIDVVAWVVLAYTLTVVSLMLVFGSWTERKGYGFAYRIGYTFFWLGSLVCALSGSIEYLIGGRVVQAIGSAMFQAVGTGMVATVFPENERGKAIGMMVMMVSAGMMTGPPLGGILLQYFPWQSIFVINLPIGVVGFFLAARYFKDLPKPKVTRKLHLGGAVTISLALLTGTLALSLLDDFSVTNIRIWGLLAFTLVALFLFYRYESQPEKALIGFEVLKNRQFATALVAAIIMFISLAGAIILIPFYLERVKGFEPQTVGLFLIIFPVLMFIIAPLSGRISDRIGSRLLTTFGMSVLVAGLYLLSGVGIGASNEYIVLCLVLMGGGVAVFNTPNSSAMMGAVSPHQRAIVSGIISTSRNIGMSMGIAISTALFAFFESRYFGGTSETPAQFVEAYGHVVLIMMGIAIAGLPFCLVRER